MTVVATEGGVVFDIPPTLWCLDTNYVEGKLTVTDPDLEHFGIKAQGKSLRKFISVYNG